MDWNQKNFKMLGLYDMEIDILNAIQTAKNLNEIAMETTIPRTSVAYNLKTLIKRKLVDQVKFGKRYRYISVSPARLAEVMQDLVDDIHVAEKEKKGARIKTTKEDEFIIHVGPKEIVPAFKRIAHESKGERIKAIQHHISFNDQVEVATPEQVVDFNEAIIKNNIIVDGILNEGAYKSYAKEIMDDPKKFKAEIESLEGRMADYHVFPDDKFAYHAEIWIFKSSTLVINWKDKVAIEITNMNMTKFFREMFEYVKESSTKIDHNRTMREMFEKLNMSNKTIS